MKLARQLFHSKWLGLASLLLFVGVASYPYTKKNTLIFYLACLCAYPLLKITFRATLKTPVVIIALCLIVWFIISASLSPHTALGFHYTHRTADKLLLILFLPALFLSHNTRRIAFSIFCASLFICAVLTNFSINLRNHTYNIDAQAYAAFFALLAACFLQQLVVHVKRWTSDQRCRHLAILFIILFGLMSYMVLFANQERVGFLVFIVCCAFVLIKQLKLLPGLLFSILAVAITLSILLLNPNNHRIKDAYQAMKTNPSAHVKADQYPGTAGVRLIEYQYAIKLSLAHPFVGLGLGNYATTLKQRYPKAYNIISQGGYPDRIENSFLFILVQTGLIGCLLYIALLLLGYWQIVRYSKGSESVLLQTFLVAYFVANMTAPQWLNHYIALLFTFPVSIAIANAINDVLARKRHTDTASQPRKSSEDTQ